MKLFNHIYIILTVFLTVYGQLLLKWRVSYWQKQLPVGINKFEFLFKLFTDFWVIQSVLLAMLAMASWMFVLTKFELSYAYPFTSLSFVLVLVASYLIFAESITITKLIGVAFIIVGVIISSKQ
jgi:multidrug transporter EmrE-like cation transporter